MFGVKPKAEGLVPDPWDVEAFLPGMQKDKDRLPVMSCVGAAEADSCMASTRAGGRGTRKKVNGNFCHQHALELSSKQKQLEFVQDFEDILEATQEQWSQEQLNMAVALSLAENEEAREQKCRSDRLVAQRLSEMGLRKVETAAHGCTFIAVAWSAGLPLDCHAFRQEVVSYLATLPNHFGPWIEERFKDFSAYLQHMQRAGSWGDNLCLQAMSHLLRPIHVVTDRPANDEALLVVEPPHQINQEAWGPPVIVAYTGWKHYEGTGEV
jgi:hypothetical protein